MRTTSPRLITFSIIYILALTAAVIVIHEATHYITSLIIGVPADGIHVDFYGINPCFSIAGQYSSVNLTLLHYSGGMVSGMLLVLAYLAYWHRKYRKYPTNLTWILGLITVTLGAQQLVQGFIEGRYHTDYVYYSGSLFSITNVLTTLAVVGAIILHFGLCSRNRIW